MADTKNKKTIIRIVVPILLVAIVALIWVAKNNTKEPGIPSNTGEDLDFALEATSLNLEELKSHGLPIMIDFGADSCIPCKEMAPVLEELNEEYQGKVIIKFVDVWKNQSLADGFPLEVIPTQFFFTPDGEPFEPSDADAMQLLRYNSNATGEHIYTAHQGGMTKEQIEQVFQEMGVEE